MTMGKLLGFEVIGKDAVFDWAKQRGNRPKEPQRHHEQRNRVEVEPDGRQQGSKNFCKFQALRYQGFIITVRQLTADP